MEYLGGSPRIWRNLNEARRHRKISRNSSQSPESLPLTELIEKTLAGARMLAQNNNSNIQKTSPSITTSKANKKRINKPGSPRDRNTKALRQLAIGTINLSSKLNECNTSRQNAIKSNKGNPILTERGNYKREEKKLTTIRSPKGKCIAKMQYPINIKELLNCHKKENIQLHKPNEVNNVDNPNKQEEKAVHKRPQFAYIKKLD